MENIEYGEVIETYVYRESGSNHGGLMMSLIGLMVVVGIIFFLLGRMVGKKLKNKNK